MVRLPSLPSLGRRLAGAAALATVAALGWAPPAVAADTQAFTWAISGGGPASDDADGIGADPRGRLVVSGGFEGTSRFDTSHVLTSAGGADIFAAGYGPGGRVRWVRSFGAGGADQAFDNDVDSRGVGVLTGSFNGSVDFGGSTLVSRGGDRPRYGDAFLLALGAWGRTHWVRQIGGGGSDGGDEVAVGPRDQIYVIGDSDGEVQLSPTTTLPPTGGRDSWAARYRRGGQLVWARSLGGAGEQQSHGIAVDRHGNAIVTGEFRGVAELGGHRLESDGASPDGFLAKLDRRGQVRWAQRFGDSDREIGRGVGADAKGHVYFTGEYQGSIRLGTGTLTSAGSDDLFLAKATRAGRVLWSIGMGGPGAEVGPEIEVDGRGYSYLTGSFAGTARFGDLVLTASGLRAAFVAKVSPRGRIVWVAQSGDSPFATLGELALGPRSVDVLGRFAGSVDLGPSHLTSAGATDFFLAKLPQALQP